jgi:hypothetical protein
VQAADHTRQIELETAPPIEKAARDQGEVGHKSVVTNALPIFIAAIINAIHYMSSDGPSYENPPTPDKYVTDRTSS